MAAGEITQYIDVAQVAIDGFWIVIAVLLYYLHQEDKREGYPLESDRSSRILVQGWPAIPAAKTFLLADGTTVRAPSGAGVSNAPIGGSPLAPHPGAPIEPHGNPLLAGVGPGSWNARADVPDVTWDNELRIIPLRVAPGFGVAEQDTDPRGLPVIGADGRTGGIVRDLWLDRSDVMFRYLEVETSQGRRVMVPVPFTRIKRDGVRVKALLGAQMEDVPPIASPDRITRLEEEKIVAYFGAGTLYATPQRQEPLL
jgi:photosynthetic reaction center H subunit